MQTNTLDQADNEARQKIGEMIKDIEIALMVTHDENNQMHARPMGTQRPRVNGQAFTGELWFITKADSPKVREIWNNSQVLLNYADPGKKSYVTVTGNAEIIRNHKKTREVWHESLRTWFPKGPDDPQLVLIRVNAEAAEYWDAPTQSVVQAFGYFKTRLTGEAPKPGEHQRVAM